MFVLMEKVAERLITDLAAESKANQQIELKNKLGKVSMDTIASCVFGVDAQSFDNPNSEFIKQAKKTFQFTIKDISKIFFLLAGGLPIFRCVNNAWHKPLESFCKHLLPSNQ